MNQAVHKSVFRALNKSANVPFTYVEGFCLKLIISLDDSHIYAEAATQHKSKQERRTSIPKEVSTKVMTRN